MTKIPSHTMPTGDVARVLGLSVERVKQLDDVLKPRREGLRRVRRYDPAVVTRVARARERAVRPGR